MRSGRAAAVPAQAGWVEVASGVTNPTAIGAGGTEGTSIVNLCTASTTLELHGELTAQPNSDDQARTVNTVPLEQYVADVAAAESPSTWAALGERGTAERELGLSADRGTGCRRSVLCGGLPTGLRRLRGHLRSDLPVLPRNAVGEPLRRRSGGGHRERGDGGRTAPARWRPRSTPRPPAGIRRAPSSRRFPTRATRYASRVPATPTMTGPCPSLCPRIQAAYPQVGTLSSIVVTQRNGLGDYGGRVQQVVVSGSGGSVTVTGNSFAAALNLLSELVHHRRAGQRRRRRLLDQRLRRWGLQFRQRAVLRQHRRHGPQPARGGHGVDPRRRRVLGGGQRRGRLQLRRRATSTAAPAASA